MELWEFFNQNNKMTKKQLISYISERFLRKENRSIGNILLLINKENQMYKTQIIKYDNKNFNFSQREVATALTLLLFIGLIRFKNQIGRSKMYEVTPLGKEVIQAIKNKKGVK